MCLSWQNMCLDRQKVNYQPSNLSVMSKNAVSVIVLVALSFMKVEKCWMLDRNYDNTWYIDIRCKFLLTSFENIFEDYNELFFFQQNYVTLHRTSVVCNRFFCQGVYNMDCIARSPDANATDNVKGFISRWELNDKPLNSHKLF